MYVWAGVRHVCLNRQEYTTLTILEDNNSRVSGGIQASLHRPLSRRHSNAKETKLVIG